MSDSVYELVEQSCQTLRLDLSTLEFAKLAEEYNFTEAQLQAVSQVLEHLRQKKVDAFSVMKGRDTNRLKSLPSLSAIYAHKNLAFIGPAGTGKTHLAQAFGYECCQRGIKTYFIKMTELRDKFTTARRTGKEASVLNGLVRPSCLIIDEVGHCEFDKENTRLFFDLIDRRYNKEGNFNIVFTSNKHPSHWRSNFNEDDSLLCALDRIFDDATVFNIKGESFRGKKLETIALQTSRVKIPGSAEKPTL